ncbi:MAG: cytochrome P450 [Anaerolineae bacterium]|nr:cytochrome P450 [Anaerolineae bacterium]
MQLTRIANDCGTAFQSDPLSFLQHAAAHSDVVAFDLHGVPHLFINDPELIHAVLVEHASKFQRTEYTRQSLSKFLGNSVLVVDGDSHRKQRQRLQPAFYHQQLARYAVQMVAHVQRAIANWQTDTPCDVHHAVLRLTLGIVTDVLFGTDAADILDDMEKLTQAISASQGREWLPSAERLAAEQADQALLERLNQRIARLIAERRAAESPRGDLLDLLVRATEDAMMTDQQARDEIITLFVAGHESTSMTLTWALLMTALHSDVQAKLRAEALRVFGERALQPEDYPQLRYTQMVLRETTRLYPTAWILFLRLLNEDLVLHGLPLRQGTTVIISPFVTQRDPRFYPQPERFDPERFAEGWEKARPRFTYLAFGGGERVCIGQHFALQEATFTLASLVRHFNILPEPDYRIEPVPLTLLQPRHPVRLRFVPLS